MFSDRVDAGKRLASTLKDYAGGDAIVLAIPRGGVIVGYEVAHKLRLHLDIIVPRKIGAPQNPELAIGAVTEDGTIMLDHRLVEYLGVPKSYIEEECDRQRLEITRRLKLYRGDIPYPNLKGRVVIIVDDGIATGATIKAALASIRKKDPKSIVIATPVAPPSTIKELKRDADRVVCISIPEHFFAIGQFYRDFPQNSDEEVKRLLQLNREEHE
ncbi:phosphoribosyltransferase [Candidatus Bathyarchaeota archaeon]|nr:phosphoribosyltransferase [Candidatus Bathyarchaeota archaeon]